MAVRGVIARHGRGYWVRAAIILVLSVLATPYVDTVLNLEPLRYWWYQQLTQLQPRPLLPHNAKIVLIGDAEHWGPELDYGATPTNREYLAKLVDALAADNAKVIALDFDVRLPNPDKAVSPGDLSGIPPQTLAGVKKLVDAIARAANAGHKIVLSRTVVFAKSGGYQTTPDIYQPFGICVRRNGETWTNPGLADNLSDTARANISCGYIALPYDMRLMPPRLYLRDGEAINSFSYAIAKAKDPDIANVAIVENSYGSYIPRSVMEEKHAIFTPADLFGNARETRDRIDGNAVIVGGEWHFSARGAGYRVDMHLTPIGLTSGAIVHANFAEAILDSRIHPQVPEWALRLAEAVFSLAAVFAFAAVSQSWLQLGAFVGLCAALVLIQIEMLQQFGVFFEAFVPLVSLFLHAIGERLAGAH